MNFEVVAMANYFDELNLEETELPLNRIERLTRETYRFLVDFDPSRFGLIFNTNTYPPASKTEIENLKVPLIDELVKKGKTIFFSKIVFSDTFVK